MRMDGTPGGMQGQDITIIYLKDKKMQYMLNTSKKLYFEGPLDEEKMMQSMSSLNKIDKETILGTEKIEGYNCTKKQIESTIEIMGFKRKNTYLVWVTDQLEMPLRTQMADGTITALRNIKKGNPDDKYFQVPKDYQKVSNLMELMEMSFSEDTNDPENKDTAPSKQPFKLPEGIKNPFKR